jgi:hypothetical protein
LQDRFLAREVIADGISGQATVEKASVRRELEMSAHMIGDGVDFLKEGKRGA